MKVSLDDLKPKARDAAKKALQELEDLDIAYAVTSTLRTVDEQYAYWLQGRKPLEEVNRARIKAGMREISPAENKYTITNCDGTRYVSNHQSGLALDVVPRNGNNPIWPSHSDIRWEQISQVMKRFGFTWGGDWKKFPDYPHYEMKA
jgi:peptidoglycan L-alanyl-D-glutamate endopeptidase CwlK